MLRRQCLQRSELRGYDPNKCVDSLYRRDCTKGVVLLEARDERAELVENELEPQLARLMYDNE